MSKNKNLFEMELNNYRKEMEKEGLVIESDRVLVYSNMFCPLGCKYCFVEDLNNGENRENFYLSQKQFDLLITLPERIRTIMLGCDTEIFQDEEEALNMIEKVSTLGKDISIITKLPLSDLVVSKLKDIYQQMKNKGNILSFSLSIPCLESGIKWEPNVPKAEDRIETLKKISAFGIPSMVAIRPLIPNIKTSEINQIIELTYQYVFGYYSGPMYLKEIDDELINSQDIENTDLLITQIEPSWMPKGNIFFKIENPKIMLYLKDLIDKKQRMFFDGAGQGVDFLRNQKL